MIKYLIVAVLAFAPQLALAAPCPAGSVFELQRPADGDPKGCIDDDGNVLYFSSVTTQGTFFGDGAGLTNLPGGGDAVLDSTQTWSGDNTFQGKGNFCKIVDEEIADAQDVVSLVDPFVTNMSSFTYKLTWSATIPEAGTWVGIGFNNDAGGNYRTSGHAAYTADSLIPGGGGSGSIAHGIAVIWQNTSLTVGSSFVGEAMISTVYGNTGIIHASVGSSFRLANAASGRMSFSGSRLATDDLTSIQMFGASGGDPTQSAIRDRQISGIVRLYRCGEKW